MTTRLKILFLCTGNSCRSQMAEGFARALKADLIEPYSAGVEPGLLDTRAVQVMAEVGVDISHHRAKNVTEMLRTKFDYVVTVCDNAHEQCPLFPGPASIVHVGFDDPGTLARDARTPAEALSHYRRVRDEIRAFVQRLPEVLTRPAAEETR